MGAPAYTEMANEITVCKQVNVVSNQWELTRQNDNTSTANIGQKHSYNKSPSSSRGKKAEGVHLVLQFVLSQ